MNKKPLERLVTMGRIVAPYGVFGWLKVVPDTEAFDGLFDYDTWWLGKITIGVKWWLKLQKFTMTLLS